MTNAATTIVPTAEGTALDHLRPDFAVSRNSESM
jgi:hypothetical protein